MIGIGFGKIKALHTAVASGLIAGVRVMHRYCWVWLALHIARVSALPYASTAGDSAWPTTFIVLLAQSFGTRTSWDILHKAGLCDHRCVLLSRVTMGVGLSALTLPLWKISCKVFVCMIDGIWLRIASVQSNLLSRHLEGLPASKYFYTSLSIVSRSTAVLINLKIVRVMALYTTVPTIPWALKCFCALDLFGYLFHNVWDCP